MPKDRDERGRDHRWRPEEEGRGREREDLEQLVRQQGEASPSLSLETSENGSRRYRLQIAVSLTGHFREHMRPILKTCQYARDAARDAASGLGSSAGRERPLKVQMYSACVKYMLEYASNRFPQAQGRCEEIAS